MMLSKVLTSWLTLPETNMAPENQWLEDEFPFGKAYFQVLLLLVSGRVVLSHAQLPNSPRAWDMDTK